MPLRARPWARLRTWTAIAAGVLANLRPLGVMLKGWCFPGFNCHGCPTASSACPIGVLAFSSAMRTWSAAALGLLLVIGAAVGRLVCGYACPVGLAQEFVHRVPGPKLRPPRWLRWGKYAVLALLVFALPWLVGFDVGGFLAVAKPQVDKADGGLSVVVTVRNPSTEPVHGVALDVVWRPKDASSPPVAAQQRFPDVVVPPGETVVLPAFATQNRLAEADLAVSSPQAEVHQEPRAWAYACTLCPVGTVEASLPNAIGDGSFPLGWMAREWPRLSVLAAVLAGCWLVSRFFCRALCPLGACYALTAPVALWRMRLDTSACVHCGACSRVCPVDLDVPKEVGGPECVACGDCQNACPMEGFSRGR